MGVMAMNEYIKREDALRQVLMVETRENMYKCMKNIPAADVVERKIGKWIWDDEGYHCSECFYHAYGNTAEIYSGQYNYCPSCGSRNGDF